MAEAAFADGFVGRWDLTTRGADQKPLPSWLELKRDEGTWRATFVGRWGNARPLPTVAVQGDQIRFVSPKQEEDSTNDLVFEGKLVDENLTGSAEGPNGTAWNWTGKRAPALKRSLNVKWGEPSNLFNGTNFSGWTFDNPAKSSSWVVDKGCLVNQSAGSNIATEGRFQDFKLHIEVNCPSKANSGIYLRGRYEVQVEDDSLQEPPSHHMGAVYGFLAPTPEQPRRPGVWQSFEITLVGRYVTVTQNGQTIINNKEIPGITGGAMDSHEELPGPIYLQGDHGGIAYRNIVLTRSSPIPPVKAGLMLAAVAHVKSALRSSKALSERASNVWWRNNRPLVRERFTAGEATNPAGGFLTGRVCDLPLWLAGSHQSIQRFDLGGRHSFAAPR